MSALPPLEDFDLVDVSEWARSLRLVTEDPAACVPALRDRPHGHEACEKAREVESWVS